MSNTNIIVKRVVFCLIAFVVLFTFGGCIKKPCSPSIEVKMIDPVNPDDPEDEWIYPHYNPSKFEIMTWDPVTKFPQHPNVTVTGYELESFRPYLARVEVTNESDVEVRGVNVVFSCNSFGLFNQGTPFGSVAVDLAPKETKSVSCTWFFSLAKKGTHMCYSARIFHPCDTILENNWCFRNFLIVFIPWDWDMYLVPFAIDLVEFEGDLTFDIDAPRGIKAEVIEGTEGEPEETYLKITKGDEEFKPGETFEINVKGMDGKRELSEFTVEFRVEEETREEQPPEEEEKGK